MDETGNIQVDSEFIALLKSRIEDIKRREKISSTAELYRHLKWLYKGKGDAINKKTLENVLKHSRNTLRYDTVKFLLETVFKQQVENESNAREIIRILSGKTTSGNNNENGDNTVDSPHEFLIKTFFYDIDDNQIEENKWTGNGKIVYLRNKDNKIIINYRNWKKEGKWLLEQQNDIDHLMVKGFFKDGSEHGTWKHYKQNVLFLEENYLDGKRHGLCRIYQNEEVIWEGIFDKGTDCKKWILYGEIKDVVNDEIDLYYLDDFLTIWKAEEEYILQGIKKNKQALPEKENSTEHFSPKSVFSLIKNIVSQLHRIPTLYVPRESEGEYTFVGELDFFTIMIETHRDEVVEILHDWIIDPEEAVNTKFLATDLIGKYRLSELKDDLFKIGLQEFLRLEEKLPQKGDFQDPGIKNRFEWVMNYIWAYSRCEEYMYRRLCELLLSSRHEVVQKWILFVPRQMPHKNFLEYIEKYLRTRGGEISKNNRYEVLKTLRELTGQATKEISPRKILLVPEIKMLYEDDSFKLLYDEIVRMPDD